MSDHDLSGCGNVSTGLPDDSFTLEKLEALIAKYPPLKNVWQELAESHGFSLDAGDHLAIGDELMREFERRHPMGTLPELHRNVHVSPVCKGIYLYRLPKVFDEMSPEFVSA